MTGAENISARRENYCRDDGAHRNIVCARRRQSACGAACRIFRKELRFMGSNEPPTVASWRFYMFSSARCQLKVGEKQN